MGFLFNRQPANYQNLDVKQYRELYADTAHVLVDVRTQSEFAGGHLPNAINIPLDQLQSRVNELPSDKPVVVVCATGNRSRTGSSIVARSGRGPVYNLQGGTMAWMMHGHPLVR